VQAAAFWQASRGYPGAKPEAKRVPASEIARFINEPGSGPSDQLYSTTLREFFYPNAKPDHVASARSVGHLLAKYVDDPVRWDADTLILRKHNDLHIKSSRYRVEKKG